MDLSKNFSEDWAETVSIILLLVGFLAALLINSPPLHYIIIFLAGFLSGRLYFIKKPTQPIFPFVLIIIGFLLGYMLGATNADRYTILVLFLMGTFLSYYLHKKGYIKIFKTKDFIK